jgi:hypothetical protein
VVQIEILDSASNVVNSYRSDAPPPAQGRRGGGGGDGDDPDDAMTAGRAPRVTTVPGRVTVNPGLNRFVWDVRNASGITVPPGRYQTRLAAGTVKLTQPFSVRIDPRVAAEGTTVADLQEQFDHNTRMRAMATEVGRLAARVQATQSRLRGATGAAADTLSRVRVLAAKLLTEPVRYGKPGLQAHISYLAGMTTGSDQKIGRDAVERAAVLRKELDALTQEIERALGPAPAAADGRRGGL